MAILLNLHFKNNEILIFYSCKTLTTMSRSNSRPPSIPSSRRFSPPIQQIKQKSSNLIGYPPMSSSFQPRHVTNASAGGMRQSITFHGQLDKHTTNINYSNSYLYGNNNVNENITLIRKADRPVSFAYGTLPEPNYLENQLRMYSEQLRLITESVRKYFEQAKILTDFKRKQLLGKNLQSDSSPQESTTFSITKVDDMVLPKNLRLYLDIVGNETNEIEPVDTITSASTSKSSSSTSQRQQEPLPSTNRSGCISTKTTTEAKTPSDQLRQFLDAIRSNQLPEEDQSNLLSAADRFNEFRVKMEHSRSKSIPNFNEYQNKKNKNENFSKFSKNLRTMNEDLETPTEASQQKDIHIQKVTQNIIDEKGIERMDFDKILDKFFQMTSNSYSIETIDNLRKCSQTLKRSINQGNMTNPNSNPFSETTNSSYYINTPGSIHDAVQNILQQTRNNVEIMDYRMKLFIDILDIQSKFSQVNLQSHRCVFCY